MTEVVVHRCVLRIRRTAGWAWGEAPDTLIAAATRALPRLIARQLPVMAGRAAGRVHVTAPLRIHIAATVRDLAALATSPLASESAWSQVRSLEQRVASAMEAALASAVEAAASSAITVAEREEAAPEPAELADAGDVVVAVAARRALQTWHRTGAIATVLARLDRRAAIALHDAVLPEGPPTRPRRRDLLAVATQTAAVLAQSAAAARSLDEVRLAVAAAVIVADEAVPAAELRVVVDAAIAASVVLAPAIAAAPRREAAPEPAARAAKPGDQVRDAAPPVVARVALRRPRHEVEIRSALPFLVLPSLHHAGWLDAAAALLELHDRRDAAFALAAGLAGKLLDPPERGWMRSRDDRAVIAAFAGSDEPIGDDAVAAAAGSLASVLPALDDTLRAVLARGRRAEVPHVLWRSARGWSLFDGDGFAVLATGTDLGALLAAAIRLIVVPAACADPATLDRIDLANLRFVTDTPPGRAEPWRRIAGLARVLWTNDTATPAAKLVALTADLDDQVARAAELAEHVDARPAIPRDLAPALDATCALAVTAALGDLAARLFPDESATPVLAWTRFRDLDARVMFEADRVRVRVPLGRRHADLMRHGFLVTVPRVPWLGDRQIDLGGG